MRKEVCPKCGVENALIESANSATINAPKNHGQYEAKDHAEVLHCYNPSCGFVIGVEEPEPGDLEAIKKGLREFRNGNFVTLDEFKSDLNREL